MRKMFEGMGGKLVTYWFCFGEYDIVLISEMPDNATAAAACIASTASGALKNLKTTALRGKHGGHAQSGIGWLSVASVTM